MSEEQLSPSSYAEAVALFRSQVIGPLLCANLRRGQVGTALRELSEQRYRAPGRTDFRRYHWQTLERWYYRYKNGGLEALKPSKRRDSGHGKALSGEQRQLLVAIRTEHPDASVSLIVRTLIADGRLDEDMISEATVRRFYRERGLDRRSLQIEKSDKVRLRWEAESPMQLWHADVCYGPNLQQDGKTLPLRIHAILDDASRYIAAIEACHTEKEMDMVRLCVKAFRIHGTPKAFYLDNGSTYSGKTLEIFCERVGVKILHAKPYDPQSRGKMERFWGTLRQGCLNHMGSLSSLHDVQVRLLSFLDKHYHISPHASLMGKSPTQVYESAVATRASDQMLTEQKLQDALTLHSTRRMRSDNTVSVAGKQWQLSQGFVAGHVVVVGRCLLYPQQAPWIEYGGKKFVLEPVEPKNNAHAIRSHRPKKGIDSVRFDPPKALLCKATGRSMEPKP